MIAPRVTAPLRQRNVILGALAALAALAWVILIGQSRSSMGMDMTMGMAPLVFLLLWVVMMIAMMFPASAPMVLMFARVQAGKRRKGDVAVPTWIFVGVYLAIWLLAGIAGYAGALAAGRIGSHSAWFESNGSRVAAFLLIVAGMYQLTPLKRVCLTKCRSPLAFILASWRDGYRGAIEMGLRHGVYCLGCCWLLFVILFPLGMMNIGLLAVVTLGIFVEKTVPYGERASTVIAGALILCGVLGIVFPHLLPSTIMPHNTMSM